MINEISLITPDDWHLHLRDGAVLQHTVPHSSKRFARAVVMPNLLPPVVSVELASQYRQRILTAIPKNMSFEPLMSLYLTDNTTTKDVDEVFNSGFVKAFKLYPSGATTNSAAGVTDLQARYPVFEQMQKRKIPLLIHGEVTGSNIDIFEREQVFIDVHLQELVKNFPELKIVFEHITTANAVDFVKQSSDFVAATITPHHLLLNRNDMLVGGIKPHYYCLPVLKHQKHQHALIDAATSANKKFFLGTDSAPHAQNKKETACGCAGIYSSHAAIELYAEAFDRVDKLANLEAFASLNGPAFYGLTANSQKINLRRESWQVDEFYPFADQKLIPMYAGQDINWKLYAI